jgi:HK97 family phage portal protein
MARLWTRAIRPPPDDITPNPTDPATAGRPGTVGPDQQVVPGDPSGVVVTGEDPPAWLPPRILPSAWSGWPADWWPPVWGSQFQRLVDIAWICVDINASALSTMPPYLVDAASSLSSDWLNNPDPDLYTSWEEFAKQVFWDYQANGEAFILATSRYATGWPARFHVLPPWAIECEIGGDGLRVYRVGDVDVTEDVLHIRYKSSVGYAHGEGPLAAVEGRVQAALTLTQYAVNLATNGGIPSSVLSVPRELTADQAALLQQQWVQARMNTLGQPAVLTGGATWEAVQLNPADMALQEMLQANEGRIADALQVPRLFVGLPSGGDPMTYKTVHDIYDFHWRGGLRPKAQAVMSALSGWLLPRGTRVELNRDEYVQPAPLERAQTAQIYASIVDPVTGQQAMTVEEIRNTLRLDNSTPADVSAGVLK